MTELSSYGQKDKKYSYSEIIILANKGWQPAIDFMNERKLKKLERAVHHPIPTTAKELHHRGEWNLIIDHILSKLIFVSEIYAQGSRIKGYWRDNKKETQYGVIKASDWDVGVVFDKEVILDAKLLQEKPFTLSGRDYLDIKTSANGVLIYSKHLGKLT